MTKKITIKPFSLQLEVFDSQATNVVYVKGRRAGGTKGAVNRLVEIAHQQPGTRHLWVDTVNRNIEKYIRLYFIPLLKNTEYKWKKGLKTLLFETKSYCDFASVKSQENMEGFGYDYFWLNEAGTILRDEKLYYEFLQPMALDSPQAQWFIIGSPKGAGLFQDMFERGQDPTQKDWVSFRHSSSVNPHLNKAALSELKKNMPERTYRQEILAEFLSGDGAVFRGVDRIATAEPEDHPQPWTSYVLGVDLARYRDYTVIWVGRTDTLTGVHCARFHRLPWKSQVERIGGLSKHYDRAPIYIDATGVGDPIVEDLRANNLPVKPIVFTTTTKRQLIDSLALAIEQEKLTIIPHEETVRELVSYEYFQQPSGHSRTSAPPGGHDDCVIALALCHWGMGSGKNEFILGSNLVSNELDW